MRARPDLTVEAQGLHFTSALSHLFVAIFAIVWLDTTRAEFVSYEGLMLTFCAFVRAHIFAFSFEIVVRRVTEAPHRQRCAAS